MGRSTGEETYVSNNATSYTVKIPASIQNDIVFLAIMCYETASISSIVGDNSGTWNLEVDASSAAQDAYVYSCSQSATPDTEVVVTFSAAEYAVFHVMNFRGGNTTTRVNAYAINSTSVSYDIPIPAVTTTADNCFIWMIASARSYPIFPAPNNMIGGCEETSSDLIFSLSASSFQKSTGTFAAQTWIHAAANTSNYNGTRITIAINDDGSNDSEGYLDFSVDAYNYLLTMSRNEGPLSFGGTYDCTSASFENISSLSNAGYTNSNIYYKSNIDYQVGPLESGWRSAASLVDSVYADYSILHTIPITETPGSADNYDLSSGLLCVSNKASDPRTHPDSDIGACLALSDKTNARFWQLGTTNSVPSLNRGIFPTIIDLSDSAYVMDDIGSPSMSSVASVIIGSQPAAYYVYTYFSPIFLLGEMRMHGGTSTSPTSFASFARASEKNMLNTVLSQGGLLDNQFLVCQDTRVGGVDGGYWDCSNQSASWPQEYNADKKKRNFKFGPATLSHTIAPESGHTAIYDSATLNFGNYHNFKVNTSEAISTVGLSVLNATPEIVSYAGSLGGISFINCKTLILNGASISGGCTIKGCVDTNSIETLVASTQASLQLLLNDIANCQFLDNSTAIRIEYTGASAPTVNFDAIVVSGNTVDLHFNSTNAVQLTANMQNGSNITTTAISGSATGVTIANDITATINVNVSGAEITILTAGTQTELFHIETGTTSEAYVYTYSSDFNGDIQVYKPGYKPYWLASNAFSDSNQTITVNLEADPASQI